MVSQARSTCFIQYHSTGAAFSKAFVVPTGYTAIVKFVDYGNETGAAVRGAFAIRSGLGAFICFFDDADVPLAKPRNWTGYAVAVAGDQLVAYAGAAGLNVWVSGALVSSDPQFPPSIGAGLFSDLFGNELAPLPALGLDH